jgi:hypothetical protein
MMKVAKAGGVRKFRRRFESSARRISTALGELEEKCTDVCNGSSVYSN